jgi:hypothetical protein
MTSCGAAKGAPFQSNSKKQQQIPPLRCGMTIILWWDGKY